MMPASFKASPDALESWGAPLQRFRNSNVLKCPQIKHRGKMSWNVPKYPQVSRNVPKCPEIAVAISRTSLALPNIIFTECQQVCAGFQGLWTCHNGFHNNCVRKCSQIEQSVHSVLKYPQISPSVPKCPQIQSGSSFCGFRDISGHFGTFGDICSV